ncbi:hypothetical protein EHQ16_03270 [Leptospira kanakyensis]|uniref:DUF6046 domain-containing protein n=1 Tax=Leptospira kanakyensis TaxID=2484968 RepID=A0A6N4Q9G6_9LEPT|nr:DUF6046 domain-containing protein [Leptospira kanakyensis]TGK47509.1 hypothetical protein EHQ11_16360 [Leptospira kanakyensis]TGK63488.1 hypothetical protein EHQ16_03270 [Leptospira kanakyensis]TGK67092.1 hypothetical protein EHQ18_18510 [Leptospira kanakyensis]
MLLDPVPGGPFLGFTAGDLDPLIIGTYTCPRGTKVTGYRPKNHSATQVQGAIGTVKEVVGYDDWHLTIEFEYVSPVGLQAMALKELKEILAVWDQLDSVTVIHPKLNALNIKFILLTKIDLPDEDRAHELPVRLEALSDDPFFDLENPL